MIVNQNVLDSAAARRIAEGRPTECDIERIPPGALVVGVPGRQAHALEVAADRALASGERVTALAERLVELLRDLTLDAGAIEHQGGPIERELARTMLRRIAEFRVDAESPTLEPRLSPDAVAVLRIAHDRGRYRYLRANRMTEGLVDRGLLVSVPLSDDYAEAEITESGEAALAAYERGGVA